MAFKNNKIFDVNREKNNQRVQNLMAQPEIVKVTVTICLSSAQHIPTVKNSLNKAFEDLEFKERGKEITVTADSAKENFGEDSVLTIAQKHDRLAKKIWKPRVKTKIVDHSDDVKQRLVSSELMFIFLYRLLSRFNLYRIKDLSDLH